MFSFDKWGPDIVADDLEVDVKLFPLFTVTVWEDTLLAHMLLGANLTIDIDFVNQCQGRRSLGADGADSRDAAAIAAPTAVTAIGAFPIPAFACCCPRCAEVPRCSRYQRADCRSS